MLAGLIAASTATADTGVVGVSPKVARPGERVDLKVGCGWCHGATSFSISLVRLANAPLDHPCRVKVKGRMENGVCSPTVARPPRKQPFVLLGNTSGGAPYAPAADPPGWKSDLRFAVPELVPGRYAFVIFTAWRGRAPGGGLIADTRPWQLLRILPSDAPVHSARGGAESTLWIVAGAATIALLLAAAFA
jgi:hypothetical protein